MSARFTRGITHGAQGWHGGFELLPFRSLAESLREAYARRILAASFDLEPIFTAVGIPVPAARAVVATYTDGTREAFGVVGNRYVPTPDDVFVAAIETAHTAAIAAGGTGLDSIMLLAGGSRLVATFNVGTRGGFRDKLVIFDGHDGLLEFGALSTSIRVVCSNTMAMAEGYAGREHAVRARHTRGIDQKAPLVVAAIGDTIASGDSIRTTYERAANLTLRGAAFTAALDVFVPPPGEKATAVAKTRYDNAIQAFTDAMALPENREGPTLAALWNAATWLEDRRATRGDSCKTENMLFGHGRKAIQDTLVKVEVLLKAGGVASVTVPEALAMGADAGQVGSAILDSMLA